MTYFQVLPPNFTQKVRLIHTTAEYEGVSKSFWTGHLEQELQTVQLSATRCSCITIFWVSQVSFAAITLCVASQRVFIIDSVYFIIDSVWKHLDTPSYNRNHIMDSTFWG